MAAELCHCTCRHWQTLMPIIFIINKETEVYNFNPQLLFCCHNLQIVANYEYLGNQSKKELGNELIAKLFIVTIQYWLYLTSFTKKDLSA